MMKSTAPLCRFLGREVPWDKPFPHLNEGNATVVRKYAASSARDLLRPAMWRG